LSQFLNSFRILTHKASCISVVKRQKRHVLRLKQHAPTQFFSLQQMHVFPSFVFAPRWRKRSFSRWCEKLLSENDAPSEAHSPYVAKGYGSCPDLVLVAKSKMMLILSLNSLNCKHENRLRHQYQEWP